METLTYFINDLFDLNKVELGDDIYQTIQGRNINSVTYKDVTVSGSLIKETVFEEVIFENVTFYATDFTNCLFINCLFLNCNFQFSNLTDCNLEETSFEDCKWIFSKLGNTDLSSSECRNNLSFHTEQTKAHEISDLRIFMGLCA